MSTVPLTVGEVRRYPVKSMLGEVLSSAEVGPQGLVGDRGWAVVDDETGLVASAKQPRLWRALLSASASLADGSVQVVLPGSARPRTPDGDDLDDLLSALLGRPVHLSDDPQPGSIIDRSDPDEVLTQGVEATVTTPQLEIGQGVLGATFLDYAPLHLVCAATVAHVGVEALRYRPNLVIDGDMTPYGEGAWVGSAVAVGPEVLLRVVLPTPRCAVPTLAHGWLPRRPLALRAPTADNLVEVPGFGILPCVGVYAEVERGGTVRPGDRVTVVPA